MILYLAALLLSSFLVSLTSTFNNSTGHCGSALLNGSFSRQERRKLHSSDMLVEKNMSPNFLRAPEERHFKMLIK